MAYRNTNYGDEHPRNLIPELCRQFYNLGWVTGTGKYNNDIYEFFFGLIQVWIKLIDICVTSAFLYSLTCTFTMYVPVGHTYFTFTLSISILLMSSPSHWLGS